MTRLTRTSLGSSETACEPRSERVAETLQYYCTGQAVLCKIGLESGVAMAITQCFMMGKRVSTRLVQRWKTTCSSEEEIECRAPPVNPLLTVAVVLCICHARDARFEPSFE